MRQKTCIKRWFVLFGLLVLSPALMAQTETLQIGVLPTLSPRALLKNYEYLRVFVARELHQPAALGTAQDFATFHRQALEDNYDLVVTAAHFARLLQREKGWIPLATYKTANQAILVVGKDSPIQKIEDLRGKSISSADPLALLAIQTQLWLQERGLISGRDYRFVQTSSFTSAAFAVTQKQIAMAIMSPSSFRQLPDNIKQEVKVFQTLPPIQAITWMAHPRRQQEVARLKQVLLDFTPETPEGREFFQLTGYKGLRETSADEMRGMDPYSDLTKPLLNSTH